MATCFLISIILNVGVKFSFGFALNPVGVTVGVTVGATVGLRAPCQHTRTALPCSNDVEVIAKASKLVKDQTYVPAILGSKGGGENWGWLMSEGEFLEASVSGRPVPLVRHRTGRGFLYNPSAKPQANFAQAVVQGMEDCGWRAVFEEVEVKGVGGGYEARPVCLFDEETLLRVKAVFRMRRPRSHYKGGRAGRGRLKVGMDEGCNVTGGRVDVDNLLKFLLDSIQGVVFEDDRQVVVVEAVKVYDNSDEGEGGIDFCVEKIEAEELLRIGGKGGGL